MILSPLASVVPVPDAQGSEYLKGADTGPFTTNCNSGPTYTVLINPGKNIPWNHPSCCTLAVTTHPVVVTGMDAESIPNTTFMVGWPPVKLIVAIPDCPKYDPGKQ